MKRYICISVLMAACYLCGTYALLLLLQVIVQIATKGSFAKENVVVVPLQFKIFSALIANLKFQLSTATFLFYSEVLSAHGY